MQSNLSDDNEDEDDGVDGGMDVLLRLYSSPEYVLCTTQMSEKVTRLPPRVPLLSSHCWGLFIVLLVR